MPTLFVFTAPYRACATININWVLDRNDIKTAMAEQVRGANIKFCNYFRLVTSTVLKDLAAKLAILS